MSSLYELQAPTNWVAPPKLWSSSSLDELQACPRRWQLLRSRWGEHERFPVRPHPAAIEGQIVHEALDRLARACGQWGNPPFGTPAFNEAVIAADFFSGFAKAVTEWQEKLAAHPRPGPPFRLRTAPQELANRTVRLFREQYQPGAGAGHAPISATSPGQVLPELLHVKGALAEVKLRHPSLPFMGVIDRVHRTEGGVEIVDFKTGKPDDKHHLQLLRYAMLWCRVTGEAPCRITAQYLDGCVSWDISQAALVEVESAVADAIAALTADLGGRPAPAKPRFGCARCPVRARCNEGWALAEEGARSDGQGDAELVVVGQPGPNGFLARDNGGAEASVVHEVAVAAQVPPIGAGQTLRVVDGVWMVKRKELEIKAWTELYLVHRDHQMTNASGGQDR